MCRLIVIVVCSLLLCSCASQQKLRKADLKKDVVLETNYGVMRVRLSDETPQHRDNFLKLAKSKYYDGVLFHRVINKFMIQAGDPNSRKAAPGKALGEGGPGYTIPSEFRTNLFHKKGVIAAAREGDDVNPQKASSGSQFYIVQGKVWTGGGLDTLEIKRLNGRKIPSEQRTAYKTVGGTPHLDQNYTVFGEVIEGLSVIDAIAAVTTSKGKDKDRPVKDVIIKKARLVKRR
jgi:cyclophilin family peptidyl-prolyl cis-trans isomerase